MELDFDMPYLSGIETEPDRMLERLENFDSEYRTAIDLTEEFIPRVPLGMIKNIVVLGINPTVVAADILRNLLVQDLALPIISVDCARGVVPGFIGNSTLVFAVSAGGADQDTVESLDICVSKSSYAIVVALDGYVAQYANKNGIPCLNLPTNMLEFAFDGYLFAPMAAIILKLGFMPAEFLPCEEVILVINNLQRNLGKDSPNMLNQAKQLAAKLHRKQVAIFSASGLTDGVAMSWASALWLRTQHLADWDVLPDLHRNALETMGLIKSFHAVFLRESAEENTIRRDFENLRAKIQARGSDVTDVVAVGQSKIARLVSLLYMGNFTIAYLRRLQSLHNITLSGEPGFN